MQYDWPGNVRELENIIERVVVLGTIDIIPAMGLTSAGPVEIPPPEPEAAGKNTSIPEGMTYREAKKKVLEDFEQDFFSRILEASGGNISEAARMAGMHRKNFYQKLEQNHLDAGDSKS
jgi:two-component system response regulator AtoC/two-component system nitrogen regulation response regulator NtrX